MQLILIQHRDGSAIPIVEDDGFDADAWAAEPDGPAGEWEYLGARAVIVHRLPCPHEPHIRPTQRVLWRRSPTRTDREED